ncbi:apoptotic chromatin condensation inducer 1b isoform 2-T2 [Polymixia lowei]
MADEDITLDGKPLQSLRVADLKAALEQRNLSKSGQKNALIKRLKGALMLENLQRSSSSHSGLQPNSQIGEEMSQNSFIKQYLAKQQELLRQRLEREAQQAAEADESPAVPEEEEDHTEGNDNPSYLTDKHRPMPSQPPLTRAEEEGGGPKMGQGMMACRPDVGPGSTLHHQDSPDAPGTWMQRPSLQPGREEQSAPSPPRAVASLSVRVLGQPDRQGLPPVVPRAQEKEGAAPAEPGSAHPVLHLSRSARAVAVGRVQEDSDEDDDGDDESEEDEEWGPGSGGTRRGSRVPPQPQQPSPSVPSAAARSRRKLQPPQHIPPPQVHQPPMQLRHPTPPPSPPPELSFPLPDTPKQSPPDMDELEEEGPGAGAGPGPAARPTPGVQRQDSDSSSRSSSPEPPQQRRPGPLSLLARKMESERAFPAAEAPGAMDMSGGTTRAGAFIAGAAGSSETPLQRMERQRQQEKMVQQQGQEEEERRLKEEKERERRQEEERQKEKKREDERERKRLEEEKEKVKRRLEEEKEKEKRRLEEEKEKEKRRLEEEKEKRRLEEQKEKEKRRLEEEERRCQEEERNREQKRREAEEKERERRLPPWKRGRDSSGAAQLSRSQSGSEDSAMDQGTAPSPQASKSSVSVRDASPQQPLSSPPPKSAADAAPSPVAKRPRVFSDAPAGPVASVAKPPRGSVVVTNVRDSGSSSDSDSGSDSSSCSSHSSSSSPDKSRPAKQLKKADQGHKEDERKMKAERGEERAYPTKREVSEPSAAAVTEVDQDSESSLAQQPASEAEPENSEGRLEESTTPKTFAGRKISLTAGSKTSPASTEGGAGGAGESDTGGAAGRKRRWGSSTAVTAKKPSISITTDSLKSLIPDIKVSQEAVVELHPEELQLSGEEEGQGVGNGRGDQDKGLKIRRTVTQVVPGDGQENGQGNEEEEEEEEEEEKTEREKPRRPSKDRRRSSRSEETMETQTSVKHDAEAKKVSPSDSLVRRSISQQKSGVSVTLDDPVLTARQPSPPRGQVSNIIHVVNLVRPFTLGQLKELLNRTGSVVEDGFWIDKIKSHCYVTYATAEEAVATRAALHGVKWPQSNPKVLSVDFCQQDELDIHKGLLKPNRAEEDHAAQPGVGPPSRLPPLMPERERDRDRDRDRERDRGLGGVRDQWAEREREMERRERARGEREWDRDKIREFGRPGEDGRRSRSRDRERRRRERAKSKEKKTDRKGEEKADEPPAKLLDDLFLKTKAAPCIYWLPLTEEQAAQRVLDRAERQKERERRRKEQQEEEDKKREEEKKERLKVREKEGAASAGVAGGRTADGDRDRERDRDRKRDGYRPRGPAGGAGGGRRSRSRSNPRDRRR